MNNQSILMSSAPFGPISRTIKFTSHSMRIRVHILNLVGVSHLSKLFHAF